MPAVSHQNERVELAMELLECRQRLRRVGWDVEQVQRLAVKSDYKPDSQEGACSHDGRRADRE